MKFHQLTLPISTAFSSKKSDFVVSSCNEYAFDWLEKWPQKIEENFVCLVGEASSGKTHLSKLWATQHSADFLTADSDIFSKWISIASGESEQKHFVLDDADLIEDDILLFYIYNTIKEKNAYLLLTAKKNPCEWALSLPDVQSRISTISILSINRPNEDAEIFIIEKMLLQRGILAKENVVEYIANTIERTYEAMNYWINKIDRSTEKGQKVSMQSVKKIIQL